MDSESTTMERKTVLNRIVLSTDSIDKKLDILSEKVVDLQEQIVALYKQKNEPVVKRRVAAVPK